MLALALVLVVVAIGHGKKVPTKADALYPVGSYFVDKVTPGAVAAKAMRKLDIANNKKNGPNTVVTNPIAVNIYYGAAWTQTQRDLMDFFTSNLGASSYMSTVQTLKNLDGTVVAPLKYGGGFWDNVDDAKTNFGGVGQDSATQCQTILQGYFNAGTIGGKSFDKTKIDFKNTIFNIITSPKVVFSDAGFCGYHTTAHLNSAPTAQSDLTVMYSLQSAALCSPFKGGTTNGQGGNAVVSTTAPNDEAVDNVIGTLTHEIFETIRCVASRTEVI